MRHSNQMEWNIFQWQWFVFVTSINRNFPARHQSFRNCLCVHFGLRNSHSCMNLAIEFQIYRAIENSISRSFVHFNWPHFTATKNMHKMPQKGKCEKKVGTAWRMRKLKIIRTSRTTTKNEKMERRIKRLSRTISKPLHFARKMRIHSIFKTHFTVEFSLFSIINIDPQFEDAIQLLVILADSQNRCSIL